MGVGLGRPRQIRRTALCTMSSWVMADGDAISRAGAEYVRTAGIKTAGKFFFNVFGMGSKM